MSCDVGKFIVGREAVPVINNFGGREKIEKPCHRTKSDVLIWLVEGNDQADAHTSVFLFLPLSRDVV